MHRIKSLPSYLLERYQDWKVKSFPENRDWFCKLANKGQKPHTIVIACCDSRVAVTSVFGQRTGELFIHRNIANLVPPFIPDGQHHGTAAAVEFAIKNLKIEHLIIMGHSNCGGVRGCIDMCQGRAPDLEKKESFVGRWLDVLRPGFERVKDITPPEAQQTMLEKEGIQVSLENLMSYPVVAEAVDSKNLTLHGIWADIADMDIESYDGTLRHFVKV